MKRRRAIGSDPGSITPATLIRLSGLALLIACLLQVVGWVLHPHGEELADLLSAGQVPSHVIMFFSWVIALLGLPALYARQAERAGRTGLVAFALVILAAAYHTYLLLYEAFAAPALAERPETRDLIVTGGPLAHGVIGNTAGILALAFPLFGIVTLRAGVFPRPVGWLQILSVPVFFLAEMLLPASVHDGLPGGATPIALMYYLLFLAYGWGGYALWAGQERSRTAPVPMQSIPASA